MSNIVCTVEGAGQPVVLIHGFCETSEIWKDFSRNLSESATVFSIDLPGFGKSELPPVPFTMDEIGAMVHEWMDENKIKNPVLIGHSLGGYVALAVAAKAPEKIAGLVLFHSTAYPDAEERKANRNKVIDFVKTHGVGPFADTFVPGLFRDKRHPAIPAVDKIARSTKPRTLVAYTEAMRDRPSRIEFLKTFGKPFLVIGGQWDQTIPASISEELGALGSQSSATILSGAAHMGMFEQPAEALSAVKTFIANCQ